MKKILLIVLMLCASLNAASKDEDLIEVRLATDSRLLPLYLAGFYNENSGLDASYLKKLETVLHFDLSHNGMTYTVKHTQERDALSNAGAFDDSGYAADWKTLNVFYVIKVRVTDKKVKARIFSVNGNLSKSAEGIELTGNLNQDRRQMHQLADMIHKALFNTDGIATTKFLYTVKIQGAKGKPLAEVWEADYDGHNARQLTNEGSLCITPAYLPPKPGFSCGSFFYVSYKTGQSKIYVASLNGGSSHRFSLLRGNQLMPAISRQRNKVAFISDFTGNPDLFLQPFSPEEGTTETPQQIFSTHQATQGTPTFSPDGKRIAFVSNKDGSPRIYVMDIPAPGTKLKDIKAKLITKQNKESSAPAWSPDGKKIAYCSMSNGVRQIWVYDFEKNNERQITEGTGNKENPTWAPNSLHLIFNSTGHDASELFLVNLNQPEAKKISSGPGEKRFPSWQP